MRKMFSVVAIAVAMVIGSYTITKAADATAPKPLRGKVTVVTKDTSGAKIVSITISSHGKVKGDPAVETVVTVDDSTKVTKEKETTALTLADVTVDSRVSVTLGDGNKALAIEIHAPHKKPANASK